MWKIYSRDGNVLGHYHRLEAAMSIIGTDSIGIKWLPLNTDQFIGLSDGGAIRFLIERQQQ